MPAPQVPPEGRHPADEASLGATSCGVWTRRAALSVLTPSQVERRLRSGTWQVPWPGVYADGGYRLDPVQRAWAAVLASRSERPPPRRQPGAARDRPRVVAAGRTAARCHGFVLVDDDDPATGAREHLLDDVASSQHTGDLRRTVHGRDRVLHRRKLTFRDGDLVQHPSGLWLTSPLRTVLDCAVLLTPEAAVCVADSALHHGRVRFEDLAQAVAQRRRHPKAERLRWVASNVDGRAESPGETLTRLLLRPHLPRLEPQVQVWHNGQLLARLDLGDEALRLAVEHDGRAAHEGRAAHDQLRDAQTRALGWTTERVTWFQVRRQQERTVRRIVGTAGRLEQQRASGPPGRRSA